MSASFCDCVNQWEPLLGLQVLKDTKHLSLWTRRGQGTRAERHEREETILHEYPVVWGRRRSFEASFDHHGIEYPSCARLGAGVVCDGEYLILFWWWWRRKNWEWSLATILYLLGHLNLIVCIQMWAWSVEKQKTFMASQNCRAVIRHHYHYHPVISVSVPGCKCKINHYHYR